MTYLNLKPVEFEALSAKKRKAFDWSGRILLPKYDGCFAMVAFWHGEPSFIMSRTGEMVKSMDHVYGKLLAAYPWITRIPFGTMVLGEAWMPNEDFSDISGMFRRQYPQPQLGFAPFDVVSYVMSGNGPLLRSSDPYAVRLDQLRVAATLPAGLYVPAPTITSTREQACELARHYKALGGYDGAISSDPNAGYMPGSGKDGEFVKVKPLLSFTLECIGYQEDVGAKTGRPTGSLVVRFEGAKSLHVATGLSEAQQANLKQFVGKLIEVEAMGLSSKGLLREPRFKGVRTDVTKADY